MVAPTWGGGYLGIGEGLCLDPLVFVLCDH